MRFPLSSSATLIVPALLTASMLYAQTPTGTIDGIVRDSTGALVPNAEVLVRNTSTGLSVARTSDAGGRYAAPLLLPGNYEVTVTAAGFRGSSQTNITLDVSQVREVSFSLEPGAASEKIEVSTQSGATIDPLTSTTGAVITAKQIDNLPLNGRNPLDLALLAPGVQGTGDTAQTTPHISGSRNANSEQQIDGVSNIVSTNNIGLGYVAYQPIVDSVQEFAVQTSVPAAEYGRTGGGVVNLVTKYGTNSLHGSAFLFAHDSTFDALPFNYKAGQAKPDQHRYQEGGVIGGPIKRDRAFFFVAFERSNNSSASSEIDTVPTARMRNGDFGEINAPIYDPQSATAVNGRVTRSRTFLNNIIPQNRQNAVAVAAFNYYPLPNAPGLTSNYYATGTTQDTYYHGDVRTDFQFTPNNRAFGRFSKYDDLNVPFNSYGECGSPDRQRPAAHHGDERVAGRYLCHSTDVAGGVPIRSESIHRGSHRLRPGI